MMFRVDGNFFGGKSKPEHSGLTSHFVTALFDPVIRHLCSQPHLSLLSPVHTQDKIHIPAALSVLAVAIAQESTHRRCTRKPFSTECAHDSAPTWQDVRYNGRSSCGGIPLWYNNPANLRHGPLFSTLPYSATRAVNTRPSPTGTDTATDSIHRQTTRKSGKPFL